MKKIIFTHTLLLLQTVRFSTIVPDCDLGNLTRRPKKVYSMLSVGNSIGSGRRKNVRIELLCMFN